MTELGLKNKRDTNEYHGILIEKRLPLAHQK
jgi:hypothetical protein